MFRTTTLAALGLALTSSVALAQPASNADRAPAQLGGEAQTYRYNDEQDRADDRAGPPPSQQQAQADNSQRDIFCRRDAAARTGYMSSRQAARNEQTSGSLGGAILGAAAGAAIGSASGNAGAGALIGGGAGLIAGTAIGSDNARRAASEVEQDYAAAYYDCMDTADGRAAPSRYADDGDRYADEPRYAEGPPPGRYVYDYYGPPPYYYGPPPVYYGPRYVRPAFSFSFGLGGGYRGGRGWDRGPRGGWRGR